MKNLKQKFIVFSSIALFTAIHSETHNLKIAQTYPLEWRVYADDLQESGYSKETAEKIAKETFNIKN